MTGMNRISFLSPNFRKLKVENKLSNVYACYHHFLETVSYLNQWLQSANTKMPIWSVRKIHPSSVDGEIPQGLEATCGTDVFLGTGELSEQAVPNWCPPEVVTFNHRHVLWLVKRLAE